MKRMDKIQAGLLVMRKKASIFVKKTMKIALLGYGKMGKMIEQLAQQQGHQVVLRIGSQNRQELSPEKLQEADVAIEFSRPDSAFDNVCACLLTGVPVVCGTTGWLERFGQAQDLCDEKGGALLYASNFSIGVNIFFAVNRLLARLMNQQPGYEVSIHEIHHLQKLDYPSGTAISLAEQIIAEHGSKKGWKAGLETPAPAAAHEIAINSAREGQVPGTHIVSWHSVIDSLEIKHAAHSREGFAAGALVAAAWLVGKRGCFSMEDVLALQENTGA